MTRIQMLNHSKKKWPVKKSARIALLMGLLMALWIFSGLIIGSGDDGKAKIKPISATQRVRIEHLQAVPRVKKISLYGVTEASRRVDLKAETEGKIVKIALKEGEYVNQGEVILQIETRDREARVAEAKALVKQGEIDYKASQKLSAKGFQAETKYVEDLAALESAKAQLIRAQIDLDNTFIRAPFEGNLERINVEVGDLVGPGVRVGQGADSDGSTIATVIDLDPFLVVGAISERDVGYLKPGMKAEAELVTGQEVEGTVRYVGSLADQLTRTFRVELEVMNPDKTVPSGVTTAISIPVRTEKAYHIAPSVMALNSQGELGVKVLKPSSEGDSDVIEGEVVFYPIEIFDNDTEGVWVSSLPEQLHLITIGQGFVSEGETVIGVPDGQLN